MVFQIEVVSDEEELSIGHIRTYTFVTSRAGLTKRVIFDEGGLSTGYPCMCSCVALHFMSLPSEGESQKSRSSSQRL